MMKRISVVLTVIFVLGIASVAGAAAANPFGDVPAGHWAYSAVSQLARDGVIEGDSDRVFNGGRTVSRYEMALIVTRAMAKMDKANADDAALIRKMVAEFSNELNGLGVRVSALETKTNKTTIYSLGFIKDDYHNLGANTTPYFERGFKYIIGFNHSVDGNFVLTAENEYIRNINFGNSAPPALIQNELKQLNFHGDIGDVNVTLGKYIHYDAIFDGEVLGAKIAVGNKPEDKLKASIQYGRLAAAYGLASFDSAAAFDPLWTGTATPQYFALEGSYAVSKATTLSGSYSQGSADNYNTAKYALVGVDHNLTKDLALKAFYGKSNYASNNKTYALGVQYKNAIPPVLGSYDIWARYLNVDATSVIKSGYWGWDRAHGAKGPEVGYDVVLIKNTILSFEIDLMKATTAGDNWQDYFYRVQLGMFLF
ncbi:MAG: S-layer y domain protein [Firmicutes bacterium]|nr:S-layer y domain protein [Bacillota bacterium]